MKNFNLKSLLISLSMGLISLLLAYNGFKIYLIGSERYIEINQIINLIGAALSGPLGAVLISVISKSQQIFGYQDYLSFAIQIFSLILFAITYKKYLFDKFTFIYFPAVWALLVFCYYFILPLPVIILWYLFTPLDLFTITIKQSLFDIIIVLFKDSFSEFLFTLIFSTLMMSSLPSKVRKPHWIKEKKLKIQHDDLKYAFVTRNLLSIRLFVWFLVISIIPMAVLITSLVEDYSESVLEQEAIVRKNMAESLRLGFSNLKREEVRQFLEGVKISFDGDFFILDSLGKYLFAKDSIKVNGFINDDYLPEITSKILSKESGSIVYKKITRV